MFSPDTYLKRREKLKKYFSKGLFLFPGNTDLPYNYRSNIFRFRQDSSFLYLFGIDQPNLFAVIDIDQNREIIFGDEVDLEDIIWTGPVESLKETALKAGITTTNKLNKIFEYVQTAQNKGQEIHFINPYRAEIKDFLSELLKYNKSDLQDKSSRTLIKALAELRSVKEEAEIAEIEKMLDVAYDMHVFAMHQAIEGKSENEIARKMEGICLSQAYAPSFPIICSVRGEVLHNTTYNNLLKKGDILLCDAGAESYKHYASDITRVCPVGGTFSSFQKSIFQIVLAANSKVKEIAKPGLFYRDAHWAAAKEIALGLTALGLMKGDVDEIVNKGAHALFFPHGIGHMLGLDVHDMENYGENIVGYDHEIQRSDQFGLAFLRMARRLQPGFVVTDEPGIYFIPELINLWEKEGRFHEFINYPEVKKHIGFGGIRLEDDLLITTEGCRVLGKAIPYTL